MPSGPNVSTMPQQITLEELRRLVRQPVEVFFRTRMGVKLDGVDEIAQEEEPFSLNGLEKYQVGKELLEAADASLALNCIQMAGRLPMAAFGAREAAEFNEKVTVVLERRVIWEQQYPHGVPAQSIALTVDDVAITGTLAGLKSQQDAASTEVDSVVEHAGTGDTAAWLQLNQRLGAVAEGKDEDLTARVHIVAGLWINHLAACASGMSLVSVQLGLDEQVVFNGMAKEEALEILHRLVTAYKAAWERPLPVACKTAWAYLQAQIKADRLAIDKPDKEVKDPHEAAQLVFEGDYYKGELTESAYLARTFEDYEDIEEELPYWAKLLYGDMAQHVQVGRQAGASA